MPSPTDFARLFIALWPPAGLEQALRVCCGLAAGPAAARRVATARLHLTLHFLGDVEHSRLPALQAALCLPFSPFELQFADCERWPHGLVVARPDAVPPELLALHAALAARLAALGLHTDDRDFRPHVTLLRHHVGPWLAARSAAALHWPVRDYVLAESLRGPRATYRVVQTCTSQAAGPNPLAAEA